MPGLPVPSAPADVLSSPASKMRRATLSASCVVDRRDALPHRRLAQTRSHPAFPPPGEHGSTNGRPLTHPSHWVAARTLDPDRKKKIVTCPFVAHFLTQIKP